MAKGSAAAQHIRPNRDEAVALLWNAVVLQDRARRDVDAAVVQAREVGVSWEAIGAALGTSRQAAWELYTGRGVS